MAEVARFLNLPDAQSATVQNSTPKNQSQRERQRLTTNPSASSSVKKRKRNSGLAPKKKLKTNCQLASDAMAQLASYLEERGGEFYHCYCHSNLIVA